MSAILSADDLNDFISPGVACIKPVETLPKQAPNLTENAYEVTSEDKIDGAKTAAPAQISLTDCLACSGCVTSAEAVLVSLQSHEEVLNTLNAYPSISPSEAAAGQDGKIFVASVSPQARASLAAIYDVSLVEAGHMIEQLLSGPGGLKSGGIHGSRFTWVLDTNVFRDICKEACAAEALNELPSSDYAKADSSSAFRFGEESAHMKQPKKPILASACPGWICYAEKTHPYVLPHLSRLKSPQAIAGTFLKSILSLRYGVPPEKIWHVAIMPCFDKKLEASREELTDIFWEARETASSLEQQDTKRGVRDVDCVITARELLMLSDLHGIRFPSLPRTPLPDSERQHFPDSEVDEFLFGSRSKTQSQRQRQPRDSGTSGGYAHHILLTYQRRHPGSKIQMERGRNPDVIDYSLIDAKGDLILKTARYYGFRNIQNLVRRLKPARKSRMPLGSASSSAGKLSQAHHRRAEQRGRIQADNGNSASNAGAAAMAEYAYVEVMACPGGCTNGGGQIKAEDAAGLLKTNAQVDEGQPNGTKDEREELKKHKVGPAEQKEWLARVDEAYYSADSSDDASSLTSEQSAEKTEASREYDGHQVQTQVQDSIGDNESTTLEKKDVEDESRIDRILEHWSTITSLGLEKLLLTSYRQVESDVGKNKSDGVSNMERVAGLASSIGGGW